MNADTLNDKSLYGTKNKQAEAEMIRLYNVEHQNLENMDIVGQEKFLPDDFMLTNPFNMFIHKPQVIKRLKTDIIKYSKYERTYDYFRCYGNTMIVVGADSSFRHPMQIVSMREKRFVEDSPKSGFYATAVGKKLRVTPEVLSNHKTRNLRRI